MLDQSQKESIYNEIVTVVGFTAEDASKIAELAPAMQKYSDEMLEKVAKRITQIPRLAEMTSAPGVMDEIKNNFQLGQMNLFLVKWILSFLIEQVLTIYICLLLIKLIKNIPALFLVI